MLRALIETYLREVGFHSTVYPDGRTLWGHPNLGEGRTFEGALTWWMGVEEAHAVASTMRPDDAPT